MLGHVMQHTHIREKKNRWKIMISDDGSTLASHLIIGQSMLSSWNIFFFSDGPSPEKRSKELSETKSRVL